MKSLSTDYSPLVRFHAQNSLVKSSPSATTEVQQQLHGTAADAHRMHAPELTNSV